MCTVSRAGQEKKKCVPAVFNRYDTICSDLLLIQRLQPHVDALHGLQGPSGTTLVYCCHLEIRWCSSIIRFLLHICRASQRPAGYFSRSTPICSHFSFSLSSAPSSSQHHQPHVAISRALRLLEGQVRNMRPAGACNSTVAASPQHSTPFIT